MSDVLNRQHFDNNIGDVKNHVTSRVDNQTQQINALIKMVTSQLENYDRRIQALEQAANQMHTKIDQIHNFVANTAPNERRILAQKMDKFKP